MQGKDNSKSSLLTPTRAPGGGNWGIGGDEYRAKGRSQCKALVYWASNGTYSECKVTRIIPGTSRTPWARPCVSVWVKIGLKTSWDKPPNQILWQKPPQTLSCRRFSAGQPWYITSTNQSAAFPLPSYNVLVILNPALWKFRDMNRFPAGLSRTTKRSYFCLQAQKQSLQWPVRYSHSKIALKP